MLSENIKNIRKEKGLSQEELAIKLNVVRQTVSKWEKGLSVPDSEMLIRLAEALDVSVNEILGEKVDITHESEQLKVLAAKLELVNEQLAGITERRRKVWHGVLTAMCIICAAVLAFQLYLVFHSAGMLTDMSGTMGVIGGADGPTAIFVTSSSPDPLSIVLLAAAVTVTAVGVVKTRR